MLDSSNSHVVLQVACIVRVPTDLIKQRLQTKLQPSVTSAARDIYLKEGILGFYRGYAMTIFREVERIIQTNMTSLGS